MSQYLRHENNTEIQPVPWILEESELANTEAPGQDLYKGLEGVNPCERIPKTRLQVKVRGRTGGLNTTDRKHNTYSTFLAHSGGLLSVMKAQLVRMVNMINMLKLVDAKLRDMTTRLSQAARWRSG